MNTAAKSALVVGAGIGGLTAAAALRRAGIEVVLCERAATLRAAGFGLSLQPNAMNALRTLDLGIDEELLRVGERALSASYRRSDGYVLRRVDAVLTEAELGAPAVVLARPDLHEVLLAHAGEDLRLELGAEVLRFAETADSVEVELVDGRTLSADVLIGADGINSAVRSQLHGAQPPRSGEFVCWLALAQFDSPVVEKGESIQYWGTGQRFGISDLGDGRVYWWATLTTTAELAANWPHGKDDLLARFTDWAPEISEIIARTPEQDILTRPAQDRPAIAEWGRGRVTLLGDAAHPMLPSLGQGANAAVEDAIVLAHALATEDSAETALRVYERRRISRATMLVDESRWLAHLEQTVDPEEVEARNRAMASPPENGGKSRLIVPMTWPGLGDWESATLPRPLSPLERWHWSADQVAPLHIVSRVRVTGDLDADAVRAGLAALVQRHPMLRTRVRSDDGRNPRFVPVAGAPIPLREVTAGDWIAEADTELRERFAPDTPPLRATLVGAAPGVHDLLLTSTYAIADAVTVLSFARQTIAFAAAGTTGWVPEIPAPPAPETLLPKEFQTAEGKRAAFDALMAEAESDRELKPLRLSAEAQPAPAQRYTRLVRRALAGSDYQSLLKACDERGVSPQSVVAAALAAAAAADTGEPQAHYAVMISVLFREHLASPLEDIHTGAYQAMLAVPTPAGPSLWDVAAAFESDYDSRVGQRRHLAGLAALEHMALDTPDQVDQAVAQLDSRGSGFLCMTCVDTREFPSRIGDWDCSDVEFVSGMSVSGMLMLTVEVGTDALSLNLGYVEGLLSASRADKLVAAVAAAVRNAVTTHNSGVAVVDQEGNIDVD
ncbi:FAD-dependent monooxygenase [Nocardia sp. CDC160]|uniref:FAD-dependent monooxygenase n=1 Tax=Nocardia sp. CDC160 TaxID=3112166 RepID=UPI002DBDDBA6|nr:FAD-dependent monooxygenase [Nocardia sp. CDC160]MEC3917915.1 FAD-dependent monooxygenase [Nocardia sp. CDC160]